MFSYLLCTTAVFVERCVLVVVFLQMFETIPQVLVIFQYLKKLAIIIYPGRKNNLNALNVLGRAFPWTYILLNTYNSLYSYYHILSTNKY